MRVPPEITVNIRGIAVGGAGVGEVTAQSDGDDNLLGITAFVPFTVPGEIVRARILQQKERYLETELLEVLEPSSERSEPPCPYYRECGGCDLQHLNYEAQRAAKYEMIRSALRVARVAPEVLSKLMPVVPSSPLGYRRRVTLHVDTTGRVGFYRANSRAVVPIEQCVVAVPEVNSALEKAGALGREFPGRISTILIDVDEHGAVVTLRCPYALGAAERAKLLERAKQLFPDVKIVSADREIGGAGRQMLELPLGQRGRLFLQLPPGAFSQVNWDVNLELVQLAVALSEAAPGKVIYDLFAGAGNFALPLARAGARVTAVETDPLLVACGRQNAKRYGLERQLEFFEGSVERFLSLGRPKQMLDALVCDPPRSGLGKTVALLPPARRLVLVSCHLPSFVRDLKLLQEQGWRVAAIQPFDMFAQTSYVEILSLYERT